MVWISLCCLQKAVYSAYLYASEESTFCAVLPPVNTQFLGNMALWHIIIHATQCFSMCFYCSAGHESAPC